MDFYQERDILTGFYLDRLVLDLPPFCRLFFNGKSTSMSKITLKKYMYQMKYFFNFIAAQYLNNKDIRQIDLTEFKTITSDEIRAYIQFVSQTMTNNYVVQLISVLSVFFNYYLKNGYINNNPVSSIERPKAQRHLMVKLTLEESNRLLLAISNETRVKLKMKKVSENEILRDKTIIIFFLSTGVRLSELVGLNYGSINLENKTAVVRRSKSGKEEIIYLTDDLVKQLELYFSSFPQTDLNAPLFTTKDGNRVTGQNLTVMVRKYVRFAGINKKITPHKLRATFGTNLYQKTHDIYMTAKLLGHTTVVTTTKYYVDIDEELKRKALEGFRIV